MAGQHELVCQTPLSPLMCRQDVVRHILPSRLLGFGLSNCILFMQALVYHNKKCLGRFVKPRLYSVAPVDEASQATNSERCPVQQLSITYDCFQAASSESPSRICVPLVTASSSEHYRFTVVGHCEQRNFVLPATYQFSGQQAAYALQRALYTTKHQQSQAASSGAVAALSPLITTSDLSVTFGKKLHTCIQGPSC